MIDQFQELLGYNDFYATVKFTKYLLSSLKNKELTRILIAPDCDATSRLLPSIASEIGESLIVGSFSPESNEKFTVAKKSPIEMMKSKENERNFYVETNNTKSNFKYISIILIGLIFAVIFIPSNLTGFAIKETSYQFNFIGYISLAIVLVATFFWLKKKFS